MFCHGCRLFLSLNDVLCSSQCPRYAWFMHALVIGLGANVFVKVRYSIFVLVVNHGSPLHASSAVLHAGAR